MKDDGKKLRLRMKETSGDDMNYWRKISERIKIKKINAIPRNR